MQLANRTRPFLALAVCGALALTGCGGRDGSPSAALPGDPPAVTSAATPEPTESSPLAAASTSPSATPSAAVPALPTPATLTDRLLATGEVPGLNAQWRWQDGVTGPAGPEAFGLCARFDLASIGASQVVERTYFPPVDTDDSAAEQVAEFPDAATTARATAVLRTWHRTCRKQVTGTAVSVGAITPVSTASGTGSWYLVRYREGNDEGRFHAFGVVAAATRIAVLSIDNGGQDYTYPAGREPMVAMVQAAAERLR